MQFNLDEHPPQEEMEKHLDEIVDLIASEPTKNRLTNLRLLLELLRRSGYDVQRHVDLYNGIKSKYCNKSR